MVAVAIAGLGSVGGLGDGSQPPRTHVAAVRATQGMRLVAAIDPDRDARDAVVQQVAGVETAPDLADLVPGSVDVLVLATPTVSRNADVAAAIELRPKVLLVEKPLALRASDAERMAAAAAAAGVTLRVNFHRRFDPRVARFASEQDPPLQVVARYGRGLFNYGSHLLDLLLERFGPAESVSSLGPLPPGEDPSISFLCRFGAGFDAVVAGVDGTAYDQFDIDLLYANHVLSLGAGGVELSSRASEAARFYAGYTHLGPLEPLDEPAVVAGFTETYAAIRDHLTTGAPLAGCDGAAAAMGIRVLEAVILSATERRAIDLS